MWLVLLLLYFSFSFSFSFFSPPFSPLFVRPVHIYIYTRYSCCTAYNNFVEQIGSHYHRHLDHHHCLTLQHFSMWVCGCVCVCVCVWGKFLLPTTASTDGILMRLGFWPLPAPSPHPYTNAKKTRIPRS